MIVACVCGYCGSLAKELEDLVGLVEVQKKKQFYSPIFRGKTQLKLSKLKESEREQSL